jgi:ParB-like chromosome segregation protein Spo0J
VNTIIEIDLDLIKPLHKVRSQRKLNELADDMKENGWQGRPLLVIERASDYQAWTGSHRIAAAEEAGLSTVPCYVIQERKLIRHGFDAVLGHVDDTDRLNAIRKIGDEAALRIMWHEGRD